MRGKCEKSVIQSPKAPQPVGPYSIGVKACHFLFLSGQSGLDPISQNLVGGGIEVQTRQALNNIKEGLIAAGVGLADVVKTTVFLTDMNDFANMNKVYSEFFQKNPPARSTVQVAALPKGGSIEIEAIAFIQDKNECCD